MKKFEEINLHFEDNEWPFVSVTHDRMVVRAVAFDDDGYLYFVRAVRDDEFGKSTLIEMSGGGVEPEEDLETAIKRELNEELGTEVEIICKIGVVDDYYNLIGRHNINNYFLCRIISFGEKHLTQGEIDDYHLSTLKLSYDEAVKEYEKSSCYPVGRLISQREMPVLTRAKEILDEYKK